MGRRLGRMLCGIRAVRRGCRLRLLPIKPGEQRGLRFVERPAWTRLRNMVGMPLDADRGNAGIDQRLVLREGFTAGGATAEVLLKTTAFLGAQQFSGREGAEFEEFVVGFAGQQGPRSSAGAIFYHIAHLACNFVVKTSLRIFSRAR